MSAEPADFGEAARPSNVYGGLLGREGLASWISSGPFVLREVSCHQWSLEVADSPLPILNTCMLGEPSVRMRGSGERPALEVT